MGVDICTWRCRIGCFTQPLKQKGRLRTLKLKYVSLSVRILLFFLLVAQCIESNPGPGPNRNRSQDNAVGRSNDTNRGVSCSGGSGSNPSRRNSRGQYSNVASGRADDVTYIGQAMNNRGKSARRSERIQSVQSSLNRWVDTHPADSQQQQQQQQSQSRDVNVSDQNRSLFDDSTSVASDVGADDGPTRDILLDIQRKVSRMDSNFDDLKKSVSELRDENKLLKQQNDDLSAKVDNLSRNLEQLDRKVEKNELKRENMEAQSRRNNLKFYGVSEDRNETWETTEQKVRHYIADTLKVPAENLGIERAHRLSSGRQNGPRPIIAKFSFFKEKERVLKAYRDLRKSTDHSGDAASSRPSVRVSEDFPERVARVRSQLFPFMMDNIHNNKRAFLRYDKLIIDGIPHTFDEESGCPVAVDR